MGVYRTCTFVFLAASLIVQVTMRSQPTLAEQTSVYPIECPYPCPEPPIAITYCPPPPSPPMPPASLPPPSELYPPPVGYVPYIPPPWFGNNVGAPPPPDPLLPYFPWYYKHPMFSNTPSASSTMSSMEMESIVCLFGSFSLLYILHLFL